MKRIIKVDQFVLQLLSLFLCLVLFSCEDDQAEKAMFERVKAVVRDYPGDALDIMDSISNPEDMGHDDFMQYTVFYALAKENNEEPIPDWFPQLQEAYNYYESRNEPIMAMLANYCLGSYYLQNEDYPQALKCFYDAAFVGENKRDYYSAGRALSMASRAYFEQGLYAEAAKLSKESLTYLEKVKGVDWDMMYPLNVIGNWCYSILELDSAVVYYSKGKEIATRVGSDAHVSRFEASIGNAFSRGGSFEKGLEHLQNALVQAEDIQDSLYIYKGMLLTYNRQNKLGQSEEYVKILEANLNSLTKRQNRKEVFAELSRYYERKGNPEVALAYRKREAAVYYTIERMKGADNILAIKKEYDSSLQNQILENQRLFFFGIILIIVLVAIVISGILYIRIRSSRFKREEQEHKNIMLEERVENFEYLRSMYKSTIVRLMRVEKQVDTLIDEYKGGDGEIPPVYVEMKELIESIRRTSNYQYVKVAEDFIRKQPNGEKFLEMLDRHNKILFMLCNFRYNQSEMASMLGMTRKSIMMRRYDIRNALIKVGVSEKEANAIIFYENEDDKEKPEVEKE